MSASKSCLTCKWAAWTGRPEEPRQKDAAWGDCTYPGPVPASRLACWINKANPHTECLTYEH